MRAKFLASRLLFHPFFNKLVILPVIFLNLVILDSCISTDSSLRNLDEEERLALIEEGPSTPENSDNEFENPPVEENQDINLWEDEYLSPTQTSLHSLIDYKFSQSLARAANKRGQRWDSTGHCLRAVRFNLWEILRKLKRRGRKLIDLNKMPCDRKSRQKCALYNAGRSAENFRRWAKDNPVSLFSELGLADVTNIPGLKLQKGFITIFRKGAHGFHDKYGHIEVVTGTKPLKACSDHCKRRKRFKKPSLVLAPIKELPALLSLKGKLKFL